MARALSADFPVELRAEHSEVVPAGRVVDYSAIYAVHGKTKAESSLLFNDQHPLVVADHRVEPIPEGCVFFDPTSLTATKRPIPPRQGLMQSLSIETINQFRHRLQSAFENRHHAILDKHHKSFFKTKGQLEAFIDQGAVQVDLLPAWQGRQSRSMSVTHALDVTRPGSEFYFDRFNTPHSPLQEFGNIERMATSVLLRERHMINRAKSARLLGQTSRQSSRNGKVLPFARTFVGPRKSVSADAQHTSSEITAFERRNHVEQDLKLCTKGELKKMIQAEGEAVPGKEVWDPVECVMTKAECPKETYLQTARRAMVLNDRRPIVQRGKVLRGQPSPSFCIVSIFRCRDDIARLDVYSQSELKTYHLVLTSAMLEEHDIRPPPRSSSVKKWLAWSKRVLDMLELSAGQLSLSSPPVGANGLPEGFSLTGEERAPPGGDARRASSQQPSGEERQGRRQPSRQHVTLFFDKY